MGMITILSALLSLLSFRLRSRASLELEVVALRHQVAVPAAATLGSASALPRRPTPVGVAISDLAAGLARDGAGEAGNGCLVATQGFSALLAVAIKIAPDWPAKDEHGIRKLIRQMSVANPIWGAPRIHGELLMLGIQVSQATVGRYMPWRPAGKIIAFPRGRRTASSLRTTGRLSCHRDDACARSGRESLVSICDQSTRCNCAQQPHNVLRS